MKILRNILALFLVICQYQCIAQILWTKRYHNDLNSTYFYHLRGITFNGNTILTSRTLFNSLTSSYYSNFQIFDDNTGNLMIDTTDNQSQFSGIANIENTKFGSGYVIGQLYNPNSLIHSDVYQFISNSGTTNTISSNDSIGNVIDIKSRNDSLFSLAEEFSLRIKLFDTSGILLGYIPIDTNSASHKFTPKSFEFSPGGILIYGQKTFNSSFNSCYCIRHVSLQGNLLFEYLSNPSANQDDIVNLFVTSNNIYLSGKRDLFNGTTGIDIREIDFNGTSVWDTLLTYQSTQRNISDFAAANGHLYFALAGNNTSVNKISTKIYSLDLQTNLLTALTEIDSLNYTTDIKLAANNNYVIACVNTSQNNSQEYKLYQLSPSSCVEFYSYLDTTPSILTYLMLNNNYVYFGGSSFLTKFDLTVLSTEQIEDQEEIKVYPNPASGRIYIQVESKFEDYKYNLFNASGGLIESNKTLRNEIDISKLSDGIYTIQLIKGKKEFLKKILISH